MSSALKLLTSYESDDESEKSDQGESESVPPKKKLKLPLPDEIKGLFKDEIKLLIPDDDPSAHEFRQRSFAHVPGNWATHIYIDVKNMESFQHDIHQIFKQHSYDAKLIKGPHISLSKVVNLQYSWINEFVTSLRQKIDTNQKFSIGWKSELQSFVNEQRTRTFIALTVHPLSSTFLSELVKSVDFVLKGYKLEKFYDPPLFHVSLLWTLGDEKEKIEADKSLNASLNARISEFFEESYEDFVVDMITCKSGDRVFNLTLGKSHES